MNDQQSSGLLAKVRGLVQGNKDLLRNAGSLAATTGLTSVFGFVFWIVAGHEYDQRTAAGRPAYGRDHRHQHHAVAGHDRHVRAGHDADR